MDMNVNTQSTFDTENIYNYMNGFLMNPSAFIIVLAVVIIYIIIFISLGNTTIATPDISITSSGSVSEALANSGDYLQTATGDLGNFLQYKRETQQKGLTPLDYGAWLDKEEDKKSNHEKR